VVGGVGPVARAVTAEDVEPELGRGLGHWLHPRISCGPQGRLPSAGATFVGLLAGWLCGPIGARRRVALLSATPPRPGDLYC
jgi:hypothetical protein